MTDATEPRDLRSRLAAPLETGSRAERALAGYMLSSLKSLPFETAASLAQKVGVSEAAVGRFCRAIGYQHFKDLKASLRADFGDHAWLIGDRLRQFHERSGEGSDQQSRALEQELAAVVQNHETAASAVFRRAARRLAHHPKVFVAGFQTERGHAMTLAHGLQYLRPEVHLADLASGHFADVLLSDPGSACLIIVDGRRYSRHSPLLAAKAREAGIPVTLITDPYCDWGRDLADEMFVVETDLNHFWDATSAMSGLIGLMLNAVFKELGPQVEDRMLRVSSLYGAFVGHSGQGRRE
ncbi:MurR/RpiR family transcriptional regulator [Phaeovulum sp.]|uniref:MurR/RpiR family transcriptional regulator n=1 Tax=Phaeovulum sp. TaxID=2934796 RepID=UPI0039E6FF79